jgi:hypothetical protein
MGYPEDNFKGAKGGQVGPGQAIKGAGRKPKLLKRALKGINVDRQDVVNIILNTLATNTASEIRNRRSALGEIFKGAGVDGVNEDSALQAWFDAIIDKGISRGDHQGLVDLLEISFGRPNQPVEHSGDISIGLPPPLEEADFGD